MLNREVCKECKEQMALGFLFIEAEKKGRETWFTGRRWVLVREAVERMGFDTSKGVAWIEPEAAAKMGLPQA
jgi:hypothetical protein